MGELSSSAGAGVAGTTILERGLAVFSKAEDTPCPASLLLVMLQTALCAHVHQGTQMRVFRAAFIIVTPDQTAPRCPSTVEKINMLWFPHMIEYCTQCGCIIYHDMQHCG